MAFQKSLWRIVLDPGGADERALIDWGDSIEPLALPWSQRAQQVRPVRATHENVLARGNAARTLEIRKRETFATHEALHAGHMDATLGLPSGKTLALHLRVANLPFPDPLPAVGSAGETTATHAHYIAAAAVLREAEPIQNQPHMRITTTFRLILEEPVKQ